MLRRGRRRECQSLVGFIFEVLYCLQMKEKFPEDPHTELAKVRRRKNNRISLACIHIANNIEGLRMYPKSSPFGALAILNVIDTEIRCTVGRDEGWRGPETIRGDSEDE